MAEDFAAHWQRVWREKAPDDASWFQREPETSLKMIERTGVPPDRGVIDIGGGASSLVDRLVAAGYDDIAVLDIAPEAMRHARERLGPAAAHVAWIAADITDWRPERRYGIWHDRAVFHFLTDPADRRKYAGALRAGLADDGQAIIATFALDGPEMCSGLPVQRHDAASMVAALGGGYDVLETRSEEHRTPRGAVQRFFWLRLRAG